MRALFRNPQFCRLWIAQVILALGDVCMRMGLLEFFRVHDLDLKVETAKILFAATLPAVVFGPLAMAWLDRWQRRSVLLISDGLRAALVVAIAGWLVPVLTGRMETRGLLAVYGMIFLIGAITTFSYPARYAMIPELMDAGMLVKANTLFTTTLAVANVAGLPLGGFIAERLGPVWALLANGLAYVLSLALIWQINVPPRADNRPAAAPKAGGWTELRTGCAYLWNHPIAMPLTVLAGVFAFLLAVFIVAVVGYAMGTLKLGTAGFAYLGVAAAAGAGGGMAVMARARPWTRATWLPFVQLLVVGTLLVLLSLTTNVWVAAALMLGMGGVGATIMIPIDSKLQEQVDVSRRGAVFAARGMFTSLTMLLGLWLQWGTALFRRTPAPTILLWLGVGAVATALLTLVVVRHRRR